MILKFEETGTNTIEANYGGYQILIEKNEKNIFEFKITGHGEIISSKPEQCAIELDIVKKEAEKTLLKNISIKMWEKEKIKVIAILALMAFFITIMHFSFSRKKNRKSFEKNLDKMLETINQIDELVKNKDGKLDAEDIKQITENLKNKFNEFKNITGKR